MNAPFRRMRSLTLALAVVGAACGSSSTADDAVPPATGSTTGASATTSTVTTVAVDTPTTVPPAATPPTTPAFAPRELHGERYCEVLLLRPIDGVPSAEVYNSYPLNDCPDATWKTLDPVAIATEAAVPLAILNGPRYWLMDSIETATGEAPPPVSFGGIEMIKRATVDLGTVGAGEPPYSEHHVNRKTVFGFATGSTVYELLATDGSTYVMQSWSQQLDPTLDEAGLADLGTRLVLPAGWSFRARTLTEPLEVITTEADAVVLQDELMNTYSKETP